MFALFWVIILKSVEKNVIISHGIYGSYPDAYYIEWDNSRRAGAGNKFGRSDESYRGGIEVKNPHLVSDSLSMLQDI